MNAHDRLFDHLLSITYEQLPPRVVRLAKDLILDGLACCYLGAAEKEADLVRRYIDKTGHAQGPCQVMGRNHGTDVLSAAFALGCFSQIHDSNDGLVDSERLELCAHPGRLIVPTAIAAGQAWKCTGKEILLAVVVAYEASYRMRKIGVLVRDIYPPILTAAHLMKFDKLSLYRAIIAGVYLASTHTGLSWPLGDEFFLGIGHTTRNGIETALLTEQGTTIASFFTREHPFTPWLDDLGQTWGVEQAYLKPYPCCRNIHAAIDVTLDLVRQHRLTPANIKQVEVLRIHGDYVGSHRIEPGAMRMVCQLNLYYVLACALTHGRVDADLFSDAARSDAGVHELSRRIFLYRQANSQATAHWPVDRTTVRIELTDGRIVQGQTDDCLGDPTRPLTGSKLQAKFIDWSKKLLTDRQQERVLKAIESLDTLNSVSELAGGRV